jgi:hypothetical protein
MTFTLSVVYRTEDLYKIRDRWDNFIKKCSCNPFFLVDFVTKFMGLCDYRLSYPLILVAEENAEVVGVVPLVIKRNFNFLKANFLFKPHFSPDFIVDEHYRNTFLRNTIDFILNNLRCNFVDLVLPSQSPNVNVLEEICAYNKLHFRKRPDERIGYCLLEVKTSWRDFERLRGGDFRRKFRRMERKMLRLGGYEVISLENNYNALLEGITCIEKKSWKERWRIKKRAYTDPELIALLNGIKNMKLGFPDFKWKVWFLKIRNELVSYALVLQFKDQGFITKTSFDERYRKYYPGIYIVHIAIRDLFENSKVKSIDFQTNFPFMKTWNPQVIPRVRFMIGKRSLFSFLTSISASESFCRVRDEILGVLANQLPI